jgi:hypothetical protein
MASKVLLFNFGNDGQGGFRLTIAPTAAISTAASAGSVLRHAERRPTDFIFLVTPAGSSAKAHSLVTQIRNSGHSRVVVVLADYCPERRPRFITTAMDHRLNMRHRQEIAP